MEIIIFSQCLRVSHCLRDYILLVVFVLTIIPNISTVHYVAILVLSVYDTSMILIDDWVEILVLQVICQRYNLDRMICQAVTQMLVQMELLSVLSLLTVVYKHFA